MAKLSDSVGVPLPPQKSWECASDLSRFNEWLTIHRVWRTKLPETLEKGTVIESIVEVKGMPNRIRWTIVHYKPPEAMTLDGVEVYLDPMDFHAILFHLKRKKEKQGARSLRFRLVAAACLTRINGSRRAIA